MREYRRQNAEAIREYRRQNAESIRERGRKYRQTDAGRAFHCASEARRRARKAAAFIADLPWSDVLAKTSGHCAYCGASEGLTVDHISTASAGRMPRAGEPDRRVRKL